jgi:argininosuccinate synthase
MLDVCLRVSLTLLQVIAPWREWTLTSRTEMLAYAEKNGIPVPAVSQALPLGDTGSLSP